MDSGPARTVSPARRERPGGCRWHTLIGTLGVLLPIAGGLGWLAGGRDAPVDWPRPNAPTLIDGRYTQALERTLRDALPGVGALRTATAALRWRLLGDPGPAVVRGCADWLFLAEELTPAPHADTDRARHVAHAAQVAAALAATGTRLVIVPVPDKARIEAAQRCTPAPPQQAGRYGRLLADLRGAGLTVLDLRPALAHADTEPPRYYALDTHWNRDGAERAAQAVAAAVAPSLAGAPATRWTFRTDTAETGSEPADLLRLARLDGAPPGWRPDVPRQAALQVNAERPGDLLDEVAPPVMLVGSSFSRNSEFPQRIGRALGVDVGTLARDGAGFAGTLDEFLAAPEYRDQRPAVLVWEFPERVAERATAP